MSRIAALLLLAAGAAAAEAEPLTAQQVLARHKAKTSIGPDPCRNPSGDEIVVCGRRESPYALPLYDPDAGHPESQAGGSRTRLEGELAKASTPCAAGAFDCRPPAAVNFFTVLPVVVKGIKALIDDD